LSRPPTKMTSLLTSPRPLPTSGNTSGSSTRRSASSVSHLGSF
jgi:hypothetical protein